MSYFLLTLLMIVGLFLIAVILLQRGRGGGLAGAFGGLGGQSAFGTRAGDTFTWITVGTVVVWIILAALAGRSIRSDMEGQFLGRESDEVKLAPSRGSETDVGEGSTSDEKGLTLPDSQDFPLGPAPKKPANPDAGDSPAPSGPKTPDDAETSESTDAAEANSKTAE
ncbi:MAG TPA: preprotein translocase subunit SecG [Planctomycetaceae bacterium]|jgi:preprotein translocase subunit SecG|nr:preprotein translocase subunit SecG [Planctomycetaceae bacterium]